MKNEHQPPLSFTPMGDVTQVEIGDTSILFTCSNALIRISIRDKHIIRIQATFSTEFTDRTSFIVLPPAEERQDRFRVKETKSGWILNAPTMQIQVNRTPCHLTFRDLEGNIIAQHRKPVGIFSAPNTVRLMNILHEKEHFYGFGHKPGPLDKRGSKMGMWVQYPDQLWELYLEADALSTCVPFFIAIRNGISYGLYLDTPARSEFDMGAGASKNYSITADDTELDYYFIYGPDPKQVLFSYSQLTGRMPLPPRWILGYHQCRWSYIPEDRVREVASELRIRKIPCDAIWLDIEYQDGWRVFTWNKEAFPKPQALIGNLARDGFKTVVVLDPGVKKDENYFVYQEGIKKNFFLSKPDETLFVGTVWAGASVFPDFLNPSVRKWWGDLHKPLIDIGVAAFWTDVNEPQFFQGHEFEEFAKTIFSDGKQTYPHSFVHNLYGQSMAQASYEALLRLRPESRPWVLSRAGWAGIQRYAAVWTHDNSSRWDHLQGTVPQLLNLGMAGIPIVGADIGGFLGSPSPELFTRWLQMGVFSPFCRNHTISGSSDQEPWAFGPEVEAISRRYISFRYMLLPYLYDITREASLTGIPIMRALILEFPHDEQCHTIEDEFLLGPSLLVAPALQQGSTSREVYLPEGAWFNPHTQETYTGPTTITVPAPLAECPLFVRRGSILPLQPVVQHSEVPVDELQLDIYPCVDSNNSVEYCHYEDDNISFDYKKGKFATTQYWCHTETTALTFIIQKPEGSYTVDSRKYVLIFRCLSHPPKQVILNGTRLTAFSDEESFTQAPKGWFWRLADKTVRVVLTDTRRRIELNLQL